MAEENEISSNLLLVFGIVCGLVGILLVGIHPIIGPALAAIGGACAIIWGANAIRTVAGYGLGTGVPSIGYMSLGIGVLGGLTGLALSSLPMFAKLPVLFGVPIIAPILSLVLSMVLGFIVAVLAKVIVGMKIPVLLRCTAEIAGAAGLSVVAFSSAIAGACDLTSILVSVIVPGYIALLFILNCMSIQEPYNACLGPDEDQRRTLSLAVTNAFLAVIIVGLLSIPTGFASLVMLIVGLIGFLYGLKTYLKKAGEGAAEVKWSGLWPEVEE